MDIRRTPDTQLANDRTGEVVRTPPEGGEARLRDMPANWEHFLHNQTELDPFDPHDGDGPLTCWSPANCDAFVEAAATLWNEW